MRSRHWATAVVVASISMLAPTLAAPSVVAGGSSPCVMATLKARPGINTAMIPETITATLTNCSTATETVTASEKTIGPFAPVRNGTLARTFTIPAGQTATWVRQKQYICCGTFGMTLKVYEGAVLLAKAKTTWTDA